MKQELKKCYECGHETIHIRNSMNFWLHFILVLLTGALWLIPLVFYMAYIRLNGKNQWKCAKCLDKVEV